MLDESIVRKYTKRWIVEKAISEQIEFFHLNLVSSSMVIKVDFDFTMSILTHNLFRIFALDLGRYSHLSDQKLFDKFLRNSADITIEKDKVGNVITQSILALAIANYFTNETIPKEVLREAMLSKVPAKLHDMNNKAYDLGYKYAKEADNRSK